jgi:hypothetical protein
MGRCYLGLNPHHVSQSLSTSCSEKSNQNMLNNSHPVGKTNARPWKCLMSGLHTRGAHLSLEDQHFGTMYRCKEDANSVDRDLENNARRVRSSAQNSLQDCHRSTGCGWTTHYYEPQHG